jgi:microcystin-dependent protein
MTNVTPAYVKRLFWLATVPYLIGGAILLTSAVDFTGKEKTNLEELTSPTEEIAIPDINKSGNPFIGEIAMFAGNFAPRGWAFCNGDLLSISQNQALFSILGTTYGGDGRTTFALPDLRGRVPVHAGGSRGPGLTERKLGKKFGSETLYFQTRGSAVRIQETTSSEQRVPGVMQPSLGMNYIIAVQGTYPSRN